MSVSTGCVFEIENSEALVYTFFDNKNQLKAVELAECTSDEMNVYISALESSLFYGSINYLYQLIWCYSFYSFLLM